VLDQAAVLISRAAHTGPLCVGRGWAAFLTAHAMPILAVVFFHADTVILRAL
jgi:hypothetical protein